MEIGQILFKKIHNCSKPWKKIKLKVNTDLHNTKINLWFQFGNSSMNWWWIRVLRSSILQKNRFYYYKCNWSSRIIMPKFHRDLKRTRMHFWFKQGVSNLNCPIFIALTNSKWHKIHLSSKIGPWWSRLITPKKIGILTKVFCTSGPKLVIPAWMGDELSCGQTRDWQTHRQTNRHTHMDTGNDNTRRPKLASGKKPPFPHTHISERKGLETLVLHI